MTGARLAAAEQARRLVERLANAPKDTPALAEAAELLRRAADALEASGPEGRPDPWTIAGRQDAHFRDYGPLSGRFAALAPPIQLVVHDDHVEGLVTYGRAYQGPPGCVHGGFVAGGFDEVLGYAQAIGPQPGMTGRLTVAYRSPTPLFEPLRYRARIERTDGRKTIVLATLRVIADDRLCAEAKGLFIAVDRRRPSVLWPEPPDDLDPATPPAAAEGGPPTPG